MPDLWNTLSLVWSGIFLRFQSLILWCCLPLVHYLIVGRSIRKWRLTPWFQQTCSVSRGSTCKVCHELYRLWFEVPFFFSICLIDWHQRNSRYVSSFLMNKEGHQDRIPNSNQVKMKSNQILIWIFKCYRSRNLVFQLLWLVHTLWDHWTRFESIFCSFLK